MAKVFTITEGLENMGALKTGGQGSVYKARRIGEIITAVKLLPTPIHSESEQDKNFASFQNEVAKLKRVNEEPNPSVVKILSSGITDSGSFPFIEMEFIEGPDMEELLKPPHSPVFTIKEAVKVAEQLSHALSHCHRKDVKHGDMKSNNVKFNNATGNYVLIDFGLSAMSDEQRRTSLRHAGAVEFMAPEQGQGQLLFQTDVYGFGVILFELLAGQVPFPLRDGSESARNQTMLAHMETAPPDLKLLRETALPTEWTDERRLKEAAVPEWLLSTIYRCLRKRPEERFANGVDLHNFIAANSVGNQPYTYVPSGEAWQEKAEDLLKEKQALLQQLSVKEAELQTLRSGQVRGPDPSSQRHERIPGQDDYQPVRRKNTAWVVAFVITLLIASALAYALVQANKNPDNTEQQTDKPKPRQPIGEYKAIVQRAHFHNEPDPTTRRAAFIQVGADVTALEEKAGFLYTEFTNSRGQVSKGWLRKEDLITVDEWRLRQANASTKPSERDIRLQLGEASAYLQTGSVEDALRLYNFLAGFDVPEALYHSAVLAFQGKNPTLGCEDALAQLRKAADLNNLTAKRTLGFLYMFAENQAVLQINGYTQCSVQKNFGRARAYLTDAAAGGDSAARQLLNELEINGGTGGDNGPD